MKIIVIKTHASDARIAAVFDNAIYTVLRGEHFQYKRVDETTFSFEARHGCGESTPFVFRLKNGSIWATYAGMPLAEKILKENQIAIAGMNVRSFENKEAARSAFRAE